MPCHSPAATPASTVRHITLCCLRHRRASPLPAHRQVSQLAGLTRIQLSQQVKLSVATITSCEAGRHRPSAWMLRRLLRAPCMVDLPEKAAEAGLEPNLGAEAADGTGPAGSGGST